MVDLDYICSLLAEEGGVLNDTVCEELLDDEHEETICNYGCEYSYPQANWWKRYFEMKAKEHIVTNETKSQEIIRCKDCKYYHKEWDGTETHFYEDYWCEWVEPDEYDYCSLAERKDNAKDDTSSR